MGTKITAAAKVALGLKSKASFGKGLSRTYVYKWIGDHYSGTSISAVRRAITKGLEEGTIKHGKTNARFLLTDAGREKFFPKKKKKAPKKKAAKKPKKASKKKKKKTTTKKTSSKKKKTTPKKKASKKTKKKTSKKKKDTKKKKTPTKSKKGKTK